MSVPEATVSDENANVRGAGKYWGLAVAILALAGAGLVLLSTARYGAGLSNDSVRYLDVARSLASGRGFVDHGGNPLFAQPPLYPMLPALIGFVTRMDPAVFAHLVNAVLFALVICLSARLFQTGSRQTTSYSLLGVCAVLLSIPLSEVYAMACLSAYSYPSWSCTSCLRSATGTKAVCYRWQSWVSQRRSGV